MLYTLLELMQFGGDSKNVTGLTVGTGQSPRCPIPTQLRLNQL